MADKFYAPNTSGSTIDTSANPPSAGQYGICWAVTDSTITSGVGPGTGWTQIGLWQVTSAPEQSLAVWVKDTPFAGGETSIGVTTSTVSLNGAAALDNIDSTPFPLTTLTAAIATTGATSMTVASASQFPSAGNYDVLIDTEIITVTAGQGTGTWTITRGARGTTAATHANGANVKWLPPAAANDNTAAASPSTISLAINLGAGSAHRIVAVLGSDVAPSVDAVHTFSDTGALSWSTGADQRDGIRNVGVGWADKPSGGSTTVTGTTTHTGATAGRAMFLIGLRKVGGGSTTQDLAGDAAAQAAASAAAAVGKPLGSAAAAAADATANLSKTDTLAGSAQGQVSATGQLQGGATITTPPLKNNTGTVLASEAGATVHVYTLAGVLVVTKTGQTTNGTGVMAINDALLNGGTTYRVVIVLASGAEGMDKLAAA